MKNISKFFYVLILLGVLQACNDPITVGTDVLDGDKSDFKSLTLDVVSNTVTEDSILVYTNTGVPVLLNNYPIGNINDPVFGKLKCDVSAQLSMPLSYDAPNYSGATLDSIVLRLPLANQSFLSDSSVMNSIEIFELTEQISDETEEFYSSQTFTYDENVIGQASFKNNLDSVSIYTVTDDGKLDTIKLAPHVNITLDAAFAQKLMAIDSVTYTKPDDFKDIIYGLRIASKTEDGNLTNFNFKTTGARVSVYYSKNSERKQFNYFFNKGAVVAYYEVDYAGSDCQVSVDGDQSFDYIQGLSGTNVKLDILNLDQFKNVIINKAVLDVFVADVEDPKGFLNNERLILTTKSDDGGFVFVDDVALALNKQTFSYFGGKLVDKNNVKKYEMNISAFLQTEIEKINNGENPSTLYLRSFLKSTDLRRSIFYGSDHTTYSPKIRITYTQL